MQEGYLMQFWSRHVWESATRQLFPCFIRPNLLKPIVLKGLSVEMSCWNSWRVEFARHSCSTIIKSMWLVKSYLWYIWYQKLIWGTFGEFWQFYVHIPSWFAILQWKRGLWLNSFGLCWNLCEVLISLTDVLYAESSLRTGLSYSQSQTFRTDLSSCGILSISPLTYILIGDRSRARS